MQKAIIVFYLSLFPFASVYSQTETDCKSNLENIFKVLDYKIKYDITLHIEGRKKSNRVLTENWNHYFRRRGFPVTYEQQKDLIYCSDSGKIVKEQMSASEFNNYIEHCSPEQALKDYKDVIREIKCEKEKYLKCIDATLAKADSTVYAKQRMGPYKFSDFRSSLLSQLLGISALDFLKIFKEFIFNNNEEVLPEVKRVIRYTSGLTDEYIIALTQKTAAKAANLLCEGIKDFDRECFLTGTLDDNIGHYQTFTANKSIDDVDSSVKWMFVSKFMPDTMAYQRITAYGDNETLALIVSSLFKEDYPDVRALRVCTCTHCYPPLRNLYGSEIKSHYDPEDSICKKTPFKIELYSSSLAQITAGYYDFDYKKRLLPVTSSGGDIAYRGVLNKEKISTQAQKLSFLAGVFMRYGCGTVNYYNYRVIPVSNSLSLAAVCSEILKETGCEHVDYIDKIPDGHKIVFAPSSEVWELMLLIHKVNEEMNGGIF